MIFYLFIFHSKEEGQARRCSDRLHADEPQHFDPPETRNAGTPSRQGSHHLETGPRPGCHRRSQETSVWRRTRIFLSGKRV